MDSYGCAIQARRLKLTKNVPHGACGRTVPRASAFKREKKTLLLPVKLSRDRAV